MPQLELIIGFTFIFLFFYSLIKYTNSIARIFSIFSLSIAIYTIGYALELLSNTQQNAEFALMIEFVGLVFIPPLWILAVYQFNYNKKTSFIMNLIIFSIPAVTLFFALTNHYYHLYYYGYDIIYYHNYSMLRLHPSLFYYIFSCFIILSFLYGFIIFFKLWKNASYSIKTQVFWLLITSSFPMIAYIIYTSNIGTVPYDLTTIGFGILAICYFIAIFKYGFLKFQEIEQAQVFDEIGEGIVIIDINNHLINFNKAAKQMYPWLSRAYLGKSINDFDEGSKLCKNSNKTFRISIQRDGYKKYLGCTVTPFFKKNKFEGKILIFQDITKNVLIEKKLKDLALKDELSGIFNKRKIIIEAKKEFYRYERYNHALSVLMMDIDLFKRINDTFGHLAGDETIKVIAKLCKSRLRKSDLIGRYGGEEFLVFLPETILDDALVIAEDIRALIAHTPIFFDEKIINVQVSIGVSSTSDYKEKITLDELIYTADKSLYAAKEFGRNCVCSNFSNLYISPHP
jgi:diguanylate cyclase (GGDEF)-like protein